jgi:probable rRNA maturation factor
MPVFVSRKAPQSAALTSRTVRGLALQMLETLGMTECELSILLCDDAQIQELNREHRGKDKPTDVLAFPQHEDLKEGHAPPDGLLGDVAISIDTAAAQARSRRDSLQNEVTVLLAHGLLHLVGYDHQSDAQEARMNAAVARLTQGLVVARRSTKRGR